MFIWNVLNDCVETGGDGGEKMATLSYLNSPVFTLEKTSVLYF